LRISFLFFFFCNFFYNCSHACNDNSTDIQPTFTLVSF